MQLLMSSIVAGGLAFFLLAKRRFDLFSLAFFSAAVYFLPGLFGYVLLPRLWSSPERIRVPLGDGAYQVMVAVLLAIWAGALVTDLIGTDRFALPVRLHGSELMPVIALALALLGLVLTVREAGTALLAPAKGELMQHLGRWWTLSVNAAMIGALAAYRGRRYRVLAACVAILLFVLYVGFRFPLALTAIGIVVLHQSALGRRRLAIAHWRFGLAGFAAASFFFVYKRLYQAVKRGDWSRVGERLTDPGYYLRAVTESEPFTVQALLDRTIRYDWHVGMEHFASLYRSLFLFPPEGFLRVPTFGELARDRLFPDARGGIASNIWAEMWSSGGWLLLTVFLALLMALLATLGAFLSTHEPAFAAPVVLLGGLWAFYLHRNDLQFQITLSKRVLGVALVCWGGALVWSFLRRRHAPEPGPDAGEPA